MVFSILVLLALPLLADEPQKVVLTNLPVAAQQTIREQAGADKLGDIEADNEDGISYTATIIRNGQGRTVTVDERGILQSVEIGIEEAPPVVKKTIQTQLGGGRLVSLEKTFEDDVVTYEVELTTTNGAGRSLTVSATGILERLQLALEEIPAAARKTIEERVAGGKLGDIYRVFEAGDLSYEATFRRGSLERDFAVSPEGKLLSEQVFLSEVPPAAQRTILERIGDGKILRTDRVHDLGTGGFTYAVDGRKNGRSFNFSVGPRGRFLGMDE